MKFKLVRTNDVTSDVKSFIFEPESKVSWQPGQYFHYLLPHQDEDDRGHERWFTCSAAPSEAQVMVSTRISDKSSSFKTALINLRPGDEIEADGPEGDFTITDTNRNYVFVAFGIGITPYRSILIEADHQGQKLNVDLIYANRTADDIPFKEELETLRQNNPSLKIDYVINPARVDKDLLKQHLDAVEKPIVYLSGPEPVVKDFAKQLEALGLPKDQIKLDDFPGYENY